MMIIQLVPIELALGRTVALVIHTKLRRQEGDEGSIERSAVVKSRSAARRYLSQCRDVDRALISAALHEVSDSGNFPQLPEGTGNTWLREFMAGTGYEVGLESCIRQILEEAALTLPDPGRR